MNDNSFFVLFSTVEKSFSRSLFWSKSWVDIFKATCYTACGHKALAARCWHQSQGGTPRKKNKNEVHTLSVLR
jgi:hypothetical protein